MNPLNPISMDNTLYRKYTQLIDEISPHLKEINKNNPSAKDPEKVKKVKSIFHRLVNFCEENRDHLASTINKEELTRLGKICKKMNKLASLHSSKRLPKNIERFNVLIKNFQLLQGSTVSNRALTTIDKTPPLRNTKETVTGPVTSNAHEPIGLFSLPTEVLGLVFQQLSNLKDAFSWISTSRRLHQVGHSIINLRNSKAFLNAIQDQTDLNPLYNLSRQMLTASTTARLPIETLEHFAYRKELATEFFNNCSDDILSMFLAKSTPEERKVFFQLLNESKINRKSLKLPPNGWLTKEHLTWFVEKLPNLESFTLRSNKLTDQDLKIICGSIEPSIPGWQNLRHLNLSGCGKITGSLLESLPRLSSLESLDLSDCSNLNWTKLADLTRLKSLTLREYHNAISSEYSILSSLTNLENLNLHNSRSADDALFVYLAPLSKLKNLVLSNCTALTGSGFTNLRNMSVLRSLDLTNCEKLENANIAPLGALPALEILNLEKCKKLSGNCFQSFSTLFNLKKLSCLGWKGFENTDFKSLELLENLEDLNLSKCHFAGAALGSLPKLPKLRSLDLSYNDLLTDNALSVLGKFKDSLEIISLTNCTKIMGYGLEFLKGLNKLKILKLDQCTSLAPDNLVHLHLLKNTLQFLDLSGCPNLSDDDLQKLYPLANLATVDLSACRNLSSAGIDALKLQLPNATILQ